MCVRQLLCAVELILVGAEGAGVEDEMAIYEQAGYNSAANVMPIAVAAVGAKPTLEKSLGADPSAEATSDTDPTNAV